MPTSLRYPKRVDAFSSKRSQEIGGVTNQRYKGRVRPLEPSGKRVDGIDPHLSISMAYQVQETVSAVTEIGIDYRAGNAVLAASFDPVSIVPTPRRDVNTIYHLPFVGG